MQEIKLCVTSRSGTGSVHSNIQINGNDAGVLYLTSSELDILSKVLNSGALNVEEDVNITVFDALDCIDEVDDDPWSD